MECDPLPVNTNVFVEEEKVLHSAFPERIQALMNEEEIACSTPGRVRELRRSLAEFFMRYQWSREAFERFITELEQDHVETVTGLILLGVRIMDYILPFLIARISVRLYKYLRRWLLGDVWFSDTLGLVLYCSMDLLGSSWWLRLATARWRVFVGFFFILGYLRITDSTEDFKGAMIGDGKWCLFLFVMRKVFCRVMLDYSGLRL
jgi:hypothetical protein